MTDATFAQLDALPTEELREQAFARARHRHDLGFFLDLFRHLPGSEAYDESDDGSLGIEAGVEEAVALWRELRGHEYGDEEPLIRARFIDYLLKSEKP
jgi:hypothetical protein